MAISKKIRFEIFKRDGFKCVYCGKTPPGIILEIDHIEPKSEGGKDDINNFVTSCFDCNRGKGKIKLDVIPSPVLDNLENLKERETQIREYRKFIKKIEARENQDIQIIDENLLSDLNKSLTESFKIATLKNFIRKLPLNELIEAADLAKLRIQDPDRRVKYFCGICWNKIRSREVSNAKN